MKNFKTILIILALFTISCKAQTVSLETMAQCSSNPESCPDVTYIKDINNSLNKYVGTWKGNLNGKTYEFKFIKQLNFGVEDDFRWDRLIGRIKVINSNGAIILITSMSLMIMRPFWGRNFQPNLEAYMVYFVGRSECVEYGNVYLRMLPSTPIR